MAGKPWSIWLSLFIIGAGALFFTPSFFGQFLLRHEPDAVVVCTIGGLLVSTGILFFALLFRWRTACLVGRLLVGLSGVLFLLSSIVSFPVDDILHRPDPIKKAFHWAILAISIGYVAVPILTSTIAAKRHLARDPG